MEHNPKQRQTRLNNNQIGELVERYQAGATLRELSDHFVIHKNTVSEQLRRHGISTRWRTVTDALADEAVELYQRGLSLQAVGSQLTINAGTVQAILKQRNIARRPVGTNQWTSQQIRSMSC